MFSRGVLCQLPFWWWLQHPQLLLLAHAGAPDEYVLFHLRYDFTAVVSAPGSFYHVESLLYSVVDAAAANGQGAITQKNTLLIAKDTLCDMLAAVRHGNGRDWWVVCPQFNSNQVFPVPTHARREYKDSLPCAKPSTGLGRASWIVSGGSRRCSHSDGQRYARANSRNDLQVFDFDRCSGEFSKPLQLTVPPVRAKISLVVWLFPPVVGLLILQHGLSKFISSIWKASDPQASRVLVAEYDFDDGSAGSTTFNAMQLAPDGKIYITNTNGIYRLTVINNPDAPGLACNLVQHGVELPSKIGLVGAEFS